MRVVRIADSFPAKAEMDELLRAGAQVWGYREGIREKFELSLSPKTKTHLAKRGLWPVDLPPPPGYKPTALWAGYDRKYGTKRDS